MKRHPDFERIKAEFEHYYCKGTMPCPRGEQEYGTWLSALHLDETLPYGQAKESFQWAKDMISLLREDEKNKYYKVLVGFPIRSMNDNVYNENDLVAAALTLAGAHPSLNHKDEFWFSPENPLNKWGVLTVIGAKPEDGAVEAILQVPKDAICPICDGEKMTDLIDKKRIVNVSLEGGCKAGVSSTGRGNECHGFEFNKKGFSLLTTDVLPGIPMARMFPIEKFLPMTKPRAERVRVVGLGAVKKTKEDAPKELQTVYDEIAQLEAELAPLTDYHKRDEINARLNTLYSKKATLLALAGIENKTKEGELSATEDPKASTDKGTQPDAKFQCPEGQHYSGVQGKCVADEPAPQTQKHEPEGTAVVTGTPVASDTSTKPVEGDYRWDQCLIDMHGGGYKEESARRICGNIRNTARLAEMRFKTALEAKAFFLSLGEMAIRAINEGSFDDCVAAVMADGKDEESAKAICAAQCKYGEQQLMHSQHELELSMALERASTAEAALADAQVKFDSEAKGLKANRDSINVKYVEEKNARLKLEGKVEQLNKDNEKHEDSTRRFQTERNELEVRLSRREKDLQEAMENSKKNSDLADKFAQELEEVRGKYSEALRINMALNKQITRQNEDFLQKERYIEELEEKVKSMKRMAKKISVKF
jgi:hypothetical protein